MRLGCKEASGLTVYKESNISASIVLWQRSMDRFVGGRKYCINDMHSLDLNSQVKEIDFLKQTAKILKFLKLMHLVFVSNYSTSERNERRAWRVKYSLHKQEAHL